MLAYDRSSTGLWVALIFLVSLNLRPAIAAVGPVLAQMGTDLAWGEGVQGVLTAIPLIAFAAVSPLVTFLARRIGIDMSILLALLCIAAGDAIRSFGGGVGIWLGTVVFASAIAVGNVLVPVIAKRDYAGHVAMATGVYSGCITAGSDLGHFVGFTDKIGGNLAHLFLVGPDIGLGAGFFPALALVGTRQVQRAHAGVGDGLDGVGCLDDFFLVEVAAFDVHLDAPHVPGHEAIAGLTELDGIFRLDLGHGRAGEGSGKKRQQQF